MAKPTARQVRAGATRVQPRQHARTLRKDCTVPDYVVRATVPTGTVSLRWGASRARLNGSMIHPQK